MNLKVLVVGDMAPFCHSYFRFKAIADLGEDLGYETISLSGNAKKSSKNPFFGAGFFNRLKYKLGYPPDQGINKSILDKTLAEKPNFIWIDKGVLIKKTTLLNIKENFPNTKLILWSSEYIKPTHNRSVYLMESLPLYDYWISPMKQNFLCPWIRKKSNSNEIFVNWGYNKYLHHPISLNEKEKDDFGGDVTFIGTFEQDRAERMLSLAKSDIRVKVWGNGWDKWIDKHPNLIVANKPLYGEDFVKSICASKINLAFLRKANYDQQTTRTIEIPACGGFMLSERTPELLSLFEEGKEAEFFDINDSEELLQKVTCYLRDEDKRQEIAKSGRARCINSRYSYNDVLKPFLLKLLDV